MKNNSMEETNNDEILWDINSDLQDSTTSIGSCYNEENPIRNQISSTKIGN